MLADPPNRRVDILGIGINALTMEQALTAIDNLIEQNQQSYLVTPNPEFVISALKDQSFKSILNRAALSLPDGAGLRAAAQFLEQDFSETFPLIRPLAIFGYGFTVALRTLFMPSSLRPIPERVTGSDLLEEIARLAAEKDWKIFLLGAEDNVAQKTAEQLKENFPNLTIQGSCPGNPLPEADTETIQFVREHEPIDILFVAYGHPKQEMWIQRNLHQTNVKLAIGVGAAFDHLTGKQKRAPLWLRKHSLEWLWRLVTQPWRWKRQLALPEFVLRVLREKLRQDQTAKQT